MPFAFSPGAEKKGIAIWLARHRIRQAAGREGAAVAEVALMINFFRRESSGFPQ
jgi:hypothetical protein